MPVARQRILLVEDDFLIAALVEDMLADLGHEVTAMAERLDAAVALAQNGCFDLALLDLRIGAVLGYPVADVLIARRIPFAFVTGQGVGGVDPAYASAPILQKPFRLEDLAAMIGRLIVERSPPRGC